MQLKNDSNLETFATNNITKIEKNPKKTKKKTLNNTSLTEHKTDINITKNNKCKKLNSNSITEHKTEHKYTFVNQEISIHKSIKGVKNLKALQEKD